MENLHNDIRVKRENSDFPATYAILKFHARIGSWILFNVNILGPNWLWRLFFGRKIVLAHLKKFCTSPLQWSSRLIDVVKPLNYSHRSLSRIFYAYGLTTREERRFANVIFQKLLRYYYIQTDIYLNLQPDGIKT